MAWPFFFFESSSICKQPTKTWKNLKHFEKTQKKHKNTKFFGALKRSSWSSEDKPSPRLLFIPQALPNPKGPSQKGLQNNDFSKPKRKRLCSSAHAKTRCQSKRMIVPFLEQWNFFHWKSICEKKKKKKSKRDQSVTFGDTILVLPKTKLKAPMEGRLSICLKLRWRFPTGLTERKEEIVTAWVVPIDRLR